MPAEEHALEAPGMPAPAFTGCSSSAGASARHASARHASTPPIAECFPAAFVCECSQIAICAFHAAIGRAACRQDVGERAERNYHLSREPDAPSGRGRPVARVSHAKASALRCIIALPPLEFPSRASAVDCGCTCRRQRVSLRCWSMLPSPHTPRNDLTSTSLASQAVNACLLTTGEGAALHRKVSRTVISCMARTR